ncbi:hypothetical protein Rhe02_34590 [Rhizocola hellebori]|uniref:Uncharacterized protein n=1 Tax=Rhizocola hellebori TaxID=1392758 RepID=A0A8J3Q8Z0_9ACTN|nr:hypothetical protein Rhe02_34590 [Rhizocola hellebori]
MALVVGALGAAAQAAPAEGAILGAGAPGVVRDSYIVVLKKGVADTATERVKRVNGKIGHRYSHALRGFEVTLSELEAKRLAADPSVDYVEQNQVVSMAGTQSPVPSWGLDRIDQTNLPLNNSFVYPGTGAGVRAYILDTGIRFSHSDFGGRAVSGFDAIDGGTADDANGHGTHVAGIVGGSSFGVAKGVTLVAVRVLNAAGTGTAAQILQGIDWVTNDHDPGELAVANLSLSGAGTSLNAAVANSIADGITYTVAAGNHGSNACNYSPAGTPAAITVGATNANDARFGNFGSCVDLFAPGSAIVSAWGAGDTDTRALTGTSQAAPHAAGTAALVLAQNPGFNPQQVRDRLVADATNDVVTNAGAGSPNKLLTVRTPGDFSLSVLHPVLGVEPNGSIANEIFIRLVSGSAQPVALSASGLPAGVTAEFAPQTVLSAAWSRLVLRANATPAAGTHTITVTGQGPNGSRSASFQLIVGSNGCPGQVLPNPGFESGEANWQDSTYVIGQRPDARSGTWNALFRGRTSDDYADSLEQKVTLPAGCTSYMLTLWVRVDSSDDRDFNADGMWLDVAGPGELFTSVGFWSNRNRGQGYQPHSVDLSRYAGKTILLRFYAFEDYWATTGFAVDDMALYAY